MTANYGGTKIYEPLNHIYGKPRHIDVKETHIMLLTDGAIWDTQSVIDLVKRESNLMQRVHTFGVGSGADEHLIKSCAF